MADAGEIRTKRAYDKPAKSDGCRVLVDRLWPRGLTKADARIDLWLKSIAPSDELRKWFAHDPAKWAAFRQRYFQELQANGQAVRTLLQIAPAGRLTLVYGAKDAQHNNAEALKEYLASRG